MKLIFNPNHLRYEFHVESRDERDPSSDRLGLAIASTARFQVVAWKAGAAKVPVYGTKDPYKAQTLAQYADDALRERIREHVIEKGGEVPVLRYHDGGIYVWSGPQENNGIVYKDIPKAAEFIFTRNPKRDIPRSAGASYDDPVWWTNSSSKAIKCADYADDDARARIADAIARNNQALEASRAEDADIEIPVPPGLTPRGYQRAGVAYAQPRKRVLFGDEMGLGKTIQAILWINLLPEVRKVLVICPAKVKRNWMKEMAGDTSLDKQGWIIRPMSVGIADSGYSQVIPDTDIVIINYELLSRRTWTGEYKTVRVKGNLVRKKVYHHELRESLKREWDMLIVDECHRLKGDPSEVIRSRLVFQIQAERMAFLSGTPMVNRPRELWNFASHLAPNVFNDKAAFMARYCAGGDYMDPTAGASNLGELQSKLRRWFMVRRLKRDVLKELPPKSRQVIELPADGCEHVVRNERLAFDKKEDVLTTLRLRVELAKASNDVEEYKSAVAKLTSGIKVAFEELSKMRRETAVAKIPLVAEHVAGILEEGHKVILFAHHKEVAYTLAETLEHYLAKQQASLNGRIHLQPPKVSTGKTPRYRFDGDRVVVVSGDETDSRSDQSVVRFQNEDQVRLFIGTMGAAGESLTLTASSFVVFAELDWVPKTVVQAEDRAHRFGQSDNVLIQHLVLEGSIDQRMATTLVEKQEIADKALDRDSADELLNDPVGGERERMATQGVSQKDVAKLAEKLTPDAIEVIHMGLRLLAGTHAEARILEGATFREVDAALGKILADQKELTPRMAALGMKFLSRYKNTQLAIVPEIQQLFSGDL